MDLAARHVFVLRHRHMAVSELISTDACRQSLVVNQVGHRLAEAVGGHVGHAEGVASRSHCLPKLFGSRQVPAVDGKIIICSP